MIVRVAAIDVGNDALKGYFGSLEKEIYIPNVIAEESEERQEYELEKETLSGLHIEVTSSSLKEGKGIYAVGKLATTYQFNDELTSDSDKSTSDQTLIMLLTSLAVDAVETLQEKDGIIEATYFISTGIPLDETKQKYRKVFRDKLKQSTHEVRFLQTPNHSGKKVILKFEEVVVNIEGFAAFVDLTTYDNGKTKNQSMLEKKILINDIGGISTDSAVINPNGEIDNISSIGIDEGISVYLDEIADSVYDKHKYKFQSRPLVVDVLTGRGTERKNHIKVKGKSVSIQKLVDEVLTKAAKVQYRHVEQIWRKAPDLDEAYLIGGGSLLLKPYLDRINEQKHEYPITFIGDLSSEDAIWTIARAYYKLSMIYAQQKGIELEIVKTGE